MFKKFKDKLAEEVKSSPQRIQQFAQAAQAAVNSASSSISDITNNDLFTIGDNDGKLNRPIDSIPETEPSAPLQASLLRANVEAMDSISEDHSDTPRQRKLSNSSFASDMSFRLPSYESPAMYHLQSDMDVSASEAEERGLSSISLDHVTKEQLYSAYRRTQERYGKYRTRYSDLARHYKVLERDNAKARSVLVETQDKALRRISELREQCSLEQSAKAHLESALRVELDERNMKIESLNTKIKLLQENTSETNMNSVDTVENSAENVSQLVDLSADDNKNEDNLQNEFNILNNKVEKMEQLLNKYKDSVKSLKDRNSQLSSELHVLNNNLESKQKENDELKSTADKLIQAQQELQQLKETNEDLQNTINSYDFNKVKETANLQSDLKQAQDEIAQLNSKMDVFNKREEEYAISLAENKLSIHKELEAKEKEIKALESNLSAKVNEAQSYYIMVQDFKKNLALLEGEKSKLAAEISELNVTKSRCSEMEIEIKELKSKCETQETCNNKQNEQLKCLELQAKQETAEKMAIIDRNNYLENRNKQISEENTAKTATITKFEKDIQEFNKDSISKSNEEFNLLSDKNKLLDEVSLWKEKYTALESEIQDERIELVKLQSEIEKLLRNHELIQSENYELHSVLTQLKSENSKLQDMKLKNKNILYIIQQFKTDLKQLKADCTTMTEETKLLYSDIVGQSLAKIENEFKVLFKTGNDTEDINKKYRQEITTLRNDITNLNTNSRDLENELRETKEKFKKLSAENNNLETEKQKLITTINEGISTQENELQERLKILSDDNLSLKKYSESALTEYENLNIKYNDLKSTHSTLNHEFGLLEKKCEQLISDKDSLYEIISTNELKCQEYENSFKSLNEEIKEKDILQKQLNEISNKFNNIEQTHNDLLKIHDSLKNDHKIVFDKCEELKIDKELLHEKVLSAEQKSLEYEKYLEQISLISKENELLKKQLEQSASNFELTSNNFNEIKQAYDILKEESNLLFEKCEVLKQEKETLYEKLLKSDQKCIETENSARILDDNLAKNPITQLQVELLQQVKDKYKELEKVNNDIQEHGTLPNSHEELNNIEKNAHVTAHSVVTNKSENESLIAEKSRLLSEIEGLQTHLRKVCNDNTLLNDQLREVMSGNGSNYKEQLSHETEKLLNELQEEKQKVNDLLRENTVLSEKNLELEDCISSHYQTFDTAQNAHKNDSETAKLQAKYDDLIQIKVKLESKVAELEQLGRSGDCNVQQMNELNEKLRLNNEKLERRLDEALVSLRHFQALEESTELEYLRNILYEYLTGTGLHSETLTKVIAAVVKFDPKQTKIVLQKEKERQGLLKQIGLL